MPAEIKFSALFGKAAANERNRRECHWLRPRMWALRHNLSAYDATYVALAEMTNAKALLTTDARLARAPGTHCLVEVL